LLAVANYAVGPVVGPDSGEGICEDPPLGFGLSLGSISEFDVSTLVGNVNPVPFNNSPVDVLTGEGVVPVNATIGGCFSFLFGPIGIAFDKYGFLFVVNEFGATSAVPGAPFNHAPTFVTVYAPGAFDDSDSG